MDQDQLQRVLARATELSQQKSAAQSAVHFDEDDLVAAAAELGVDREHALLAYRKVNEEDAQLRAARSRRAAGLYLFIGIAVGLGLVGLALAWLMPG